MLSNLVECPTYVPDERTTAAKPRPRKTKGKPRYELFEQIGAGAMGTVYRAQDHELNRTVAVKILLPELASDLCNLLRLKREVVLASRVSHRHVIRVHDWGEVDGKPLIVMEWIDGGSLATLLSQRHGLPPSQVFNLARQICHGLSAIHMANIVHRDLKPGNLLIRKDGDVVLSDFGLAQSSLSGDLTLSRPGDSFGTARYMAPEQLAGLPADARSDLYSFGLVLLEMLTGTTSLETLEAFRMRLIVSQEERRIRSEHLRKLAALDRVIRRCLRLDRSERYSSADEVLADLETAVSENASGVSAAPVEHTQAKGGIHSNRMLPWLAAVVLTGSAFWASQKYQSRDPYAAPIIVAGAPDHLYAKAINLMGAHSNEADLRRALQDLETVVGNGWNHASAIHAELEVLIRLYEKTQDTTWLAQARRVLREAAAAGLGREDLTLFQARIDLNAGMFQDVIRNLQTDSALLGSSEPANRLLGRAIEASGRVEQAVPYYRAAIGLAPESWLSHNELGSAFLDLGDLEAARKQFVRVIELRPGEVAGYSNAGIALLHAGDVAGARKRFEIALELGPSSTTYQNLGVACYYAHEYATSIPFFESAIKLRPNSDIYVGSMADALWHSGQRESARESYLQAIALLAHIALARPLSVEEACRRARCLARLGDSAAARAALKSLAPSNSQDRIFLYSSAVLAIMEGRPLEARGFIDNAVGHGYPLALVKMDPDLVSSF
jgi:tetratricopeptide (TPR) repeat protein